MSSSATPVKISIKPRHPQFDLRAALASDWHSSDPFKTAFFNALSLTFPVGEKFFIDSVRAFEHRIDDPKLNRDVRGFIGQEAVHRREHRTYNTLLAESRGYDDAPAFEATLQERINSRVQNSPFPALLETVCFEHLTAIFAHGLLHDPRWLDGADPTLRAMWQWHAIEEIEHKAVTFDVYRAVGGDMERLRYALPLVTKQLFADVFTGVRLMLRADGLHHNPWVWGRGLVWLFGLNGVVTHLYGQWRDFRRQDFHPWQHDNSARIEEWRNQQETALTIA